MKKLVLYVHGKGGNPGEAEHYRPLFPDCDVAGLAYRAETPWEAAEEFPALFEACCAGYDSVTLVANSIGAYFSMGALAQKPIAKALLISPVVDMEALIAGRMAAAGVTEAELERRGEIPTADGEPLTMAYLRYVRAHPLTWNVPTAILYADGDFLTSAETMAAFARRIGAPLTVMAGGEHWFHTPEQMAFLDDWVRRFR